MTLPPGSGPPPHIHHWTDEWFYFPEGGIVVYTSYEMYPNESQIPNGIQLPKANMHRYRSKPGDLVYAPRYYVHGFRNEDNVNRPLINTWSPDKASRYFFDVGQMITDPSKLPPIGEGNKKLFVTEAPKHGINMSSSWDEYVASWNDDWIPPLGMAARGQELLDLLKSVEDPIEVSHASNMQAVLFQPLYIFIYSIMFINVYMLSVRT